MIRTLIKFSIFSFFVYLIACAVLFALQRSLIYFPHKNSHQNDAGTLQLVLNGVNLQVIGRNKISEQAVIYFGGNAEDVANAMPELSQAFPDQALYLLHYRSYGGSSGEPSERALFADALALYDKVKISHKNITIVGRSLGSGVATYLASQRETQRLVLITPFDSVQSIAAESFWFFPIDLILRDKYESWRYAELVKAPTTLIAAANDTLIPYKHTEVLQQHFAKGLANIVVLDGVGHNDVFKNENYITVLGQQVVR